MICKAIYTGRHSVRQGFRRTESRDRWERSATGRGEHDQPHRARTDDPPSPSVLNMVLPPRHTPTDTALTASVDVTSKWSEGRRSPAAYRRVRRATPVAGR